MHHQRFLKMTSRFRQVFCCFFHFSFVISAIWRVYGFVRFSTELRINLPIGGFPLTEIPGRNARFQIKRHALEYRWHLPWMVVKATRKSVRSIRSYLLCNTITLLEAIARNRCLGTTTLPDSTGGTSRGPVQILPPPQGYHQPIPQWP